MAVILVIDDNEVIRELVRKYLGKAGYEVVCAANGKEGLKRCIEQTVDLVITDIIMPIQEGMETIWEIKKRFTGMKIIAMSAGGTIGPEEYLKTAGKIGAHRTLKKPIKNEELLGAVKELLTEQ